MFLLSIMSMNFFQVVFNKRQTVRIVAKRAPKRRCSSHTFRYGYLVTT